MIYRKICLWISNTDFYAYIILHIIPFIRFSTQLTKTRGNQYNAAYALLERGDFIVTKDKNKGTAILIGGEWSHAVLFLGKKSEGEDYECAEMTHHNYTRSDFFDIVKESSDFAIYRCVNFDKEYAREVTYLCKKNFSKAKYDIAFSLGIRMLYCSELVYEADYQRRCGFDLADLVSLGQRYISPTGLTLGKNVVQIFNSANFAPRY